MKVGLVWPILGPASTGRTLVGLWVRWGSVGVAEVVWVRAFMALFSFSFTCSYSIFVLDEQKLQNRNNAT